MDSITVLCINIFFGEEKITPKKEIAKRRLLLTRTNGNMFWTVLDLSRI